MTSDNTVIHLRDRFFIHEGAIRRLTWLSLILLSIPFFMQAGTIRGIVRSADTREPLPGANVFVPTTSLGCIADATGRFQLALPPGTYTVRVTMIGYDHYETILVVASDTSLIDFNPMLKERPLSVPEVVIKGRRDRELESSSRLAEKQASSIISVVGAQTIERSTDRTVADVLSRVPGLSVSRDRNGEGQYVVMRGHDQMDINTSALFVSYQPYFTNDWFALDGSNDYHLLPASAAAGKGFTPPAPTPTNYWYNPYFGNTVQLPGDRNIGAISGASSTTAVNANESMPTSFSLQQNYPNPFNPTTTIQFQLPTESIVTLKVYNLLGQEIRTLVNGDLHAGVHIVSFDASNLSSGIYVYRLQAGEFSQVRRMMLIK